MDNGTRPTRITTGWRIVLVAAPLLLALATAGLAAPSWKPLPPFGGLVVELAAAEGAPLLYAGTEWAGLLRSSNGGASWQPAQVPEPVGVKELAVDRRDPRVVFAAITTSGSGGVLRSLDGGAHWQPVNHGLSDRALSWVEDLAFDPFDARKLYAATGDGLWQTRDRGASWQRTGLAGTSIYAVAVDPFRPGVLFASGVQHQTLEAELLASLDGGATWAPSGQGIEGDHTVFEALVFHPTSPGTLFALGNAHSTYVSRDGGATWTKLGQSLDSLTFGPAGSLFGAPFDAGGLVSGVVKSVDGGLTWSQTGPPDRITQVLRANGFLYAAGNFGVWVSIDNGAHWRPSIRGLSARNIADLTESGSVLYASAAPEGVQASRTGGLSWQQLGDANHPHPEGMLLRFLTAGPDALYAEEQIGGLAPRVALVRSTDGGASWSELADPGLNGSFGTLAVDPRHPEVLYAGSIDLHTLEDPRCHLARSVDSGTSWSCLVDEGSVSSIAVERATSTPYLINEGNMFTLAGGTRLEPRSAGLPANSTSDFAFDPRRAGTLYAATTEGVFKTVDGGTSWTRTSRGLPAGAAVSSVAVDPHRRGVVYAGLQGQVYRSLDAGRTWRRFGSGLPEHAPIVDLLPSARDPRSLYAVAAEHGLFWQAR